LAPADCGAKNLRPAPRRAMPGPARGPCCCPAFRRGGGPAAPWRGGPAQFLPRPVVGDKRNRSQLSQFALPPKRQCQARLINKGHRARPLVGGRPEQWGYTPLTRIEPGRKGPKARLNQTPKKAESRRAAKVRCALIGFGGPMDGPPGQWGPGSIFNIDHGPTKASSQKPYRLVPPAPPSCSIGPSYFLLLARAPASRPPSWEKPFNVAGLAGPQYFRGSVSRGNGRGGGTGSQQPNLAPKLPARTPSWLTWGRRPGPPFQAHYVGACMGLARIFVSQPPGKPRAQEPRAARSNSIAQGPAFFFVPALRPPAKVRNPTAFPVCLGKAQRGFPLGMGPPSASPGPITPPNRGTWRAHTEGPASHPPNIYSGPPPH